MRRPPFEHFGNGMAGAEQVAAQIDLDGPVEDLEGDVERVAVLADVVRGQVGRIGVEDVELAELCHGPLDQVSHLVLVADVGVAADGPTALAGDPPGHLFRGRGVDVADHHHGALLAQPD
jgi:hypothetical protein